MVPEKPIEKNREKTSLKRSTAFTLRLARAAVISALYVALSFVAPAFGPVQFRLSEALTVLPLIFPEAIVGVTLGCFLAKLIGSATTLVAAAATWALGKLLRNRAARIAAGVVPPILLNALVIPLDLILCGFDDGMSYLVMFGTVGAGQCICILALGVPLFFAAERVFRPKKRAAANGAPAPEAASAPARPEPAAEEKDTHSSGS